MHITPSEAYDPIDIASLCLWKQEQAGDNQDRIRRLLSNLPLAVHQELTPPAAADFADALYRRYERDGHRQGAEAEQIHRVPVVEPQHGEAVQVPAVQFVKIGS